MRRQAITGVTAVAREEQQHNERMVIAEAALIGERRVSLVRLAMFALFGLSQQVVGPLFGARLRFDPYKMAAIGAYLFFAVATYVQVRRVKPDPKKALFIPLVLTTIDYGFMSFVGVRDYQVNGVLHSSMGAIAFALVLCFSVARSSWIHVLQSTVMACVAYLAIGLYSRQIHPMDMSFVAGGLVALGLLIGLTNRYVHVMFTDLRKRDNLSRFLPRPIVERVLSLGGLALAPVQREVTVLFSDIRGFTALSEAMAPRDVLRFLDEYFGHMAQVVKGHDGIVNKFLGDGMLAFWGVPDRNPDHAELALRAALDMRAVLVELNQVREKRGEAPVRIGIGVHTGPVAAGMLGGADQHEYTVIGDAVNVASRVEGLTKTLEVDILVSESAWLLTRGRFRGTRMPEQKIKGRSEPVVVYTLSEVAG